MTERIIPDIPRIKAHWDKNTSDPVPYLIVPCGDGETRIFVEKIVQPKPQTAFISKIFKENTYGGYKAKHNKK